MLTDLLNVSLRHSRVCCVLFSLPLLHKVLQGAHEVHHQAHGKRVELWLGWELACVAAQHAGAAHQAFSHGCRTYSTQFASFLLSGNIQGYKDIYLPMTFKCTQEFVLVTLHSYSALTDRQNITITRISHG